MGSNFYRLWISQILSQVAINLLNFLLLAKIFTITGSTIATSLLWVSYAISTIFFGPFGAGVVDMVSRRKTLIITNLLQSLTIFLYVFAHEYSIFLLYAVVVLYSFLNQFYVPAEAATLPSVVTKDKLPMANSRFFITQQIALVAGFGLAGLLEALFGFEGALLLCAGALFLAFISVISLPKLKPRVKVPKNWEDIIKTFFHHVLEGYRFIKNKKSILYPLSLIFMIQVGLAIVIANLPIIGEQILKVDVKYVGLLVVVPAGLGATVGSVYITKALKKGWRKKWLIDLGLASLGFSAVAVAWALPFIPETVRFICGPILLIFTGLGFVMVNIPTVTYLQETTPEWLRGRVFGNLGFFVTVATIFPIIFTGVISEFFGVKTLLTILSIGVILVLYFSLNKGQKLIEENFRN